MRFILSLVILFAFIGSYPAITSAQGASPAATPSAECVYPELPPGTPTPMEASPAAMEGMEEMAGASPEVAEEASPEVVGTPAPPEGTPAEQADIDLVTALYESAVACINSGDYLGFAALSTPEALLEEYGTTNPYDVPVIFESFDVPPFQLVSVESVLVLADGRLYAETVYLVGNALSKEGAYFAERDGTLLFDSGTVDLPVDVPADAQAADVTMVDFEFQIGQDTFDTGSPIAFSITNQGDYPHEFVVMRLPEGVTVEQVAEDPSLFAQVTFIGGTFAEPGQQAPPLVLLDMEPGTYTVVCFVDTPDGVPHVARGMIAEITIE